MSVISLKWMRTPQVIQALQGNRKILTLDKTMTKTKNDRRHLTQTEFDKLLAAVKGTRNVERDRCLLLLMFRHALRVSKAVALRCHKSILKAACCMYRALKKDCLQHIRYAVTKLELLRLGWLNVRRCSLLLRISLSVSVGRS